ncbi:MAG: MATE family efflux transporter [Akkermansia sp.]|nr:MATE family efflux transporter [Akkermansia sp.]
MEKDQKLVDLEQMPMGRLLAQYSLPAIVGMAAMSFYNIVDSIYIGQCCGAYAITAMGLLFPIMNLLVALGTLVGLGGAATTSITLGQQDFPRAFRVLGHCTIMGFALGIMFGWFPLPWTDEILYLFGADANTVEPARDFMLVLMLTCPLTFSFMNLNHVMRASGYPYKAMYSLLISMVVNIACAHLFVYVLEWGMTGAALATTAGQGVGMLWVLAHFLSRRSVIYFRGRMWKLCGPIMRRICLLGLPPCLMNLCGCLVVIVFNTQFLRYEGAMGVGAYSIVNRVLLSIAMVVVGIAQGMQPIAGYNLGIGYYSRVRRVFYYAVGSGFVLTLICWLGIQLFPEAVVRAFVKEQDANSTQLITLATHGLRIMGLAFPLVGTQIIIGNFFQSIGRPIMSVFLNISRQFLVLIPCLLLLPLCFEGEGIWLSQMVADVFCALLSYLVIYLFFTKVFHKKDTSLH